MCSPAMSLQKAAPLWLSDGGPGLWVHLFHVSLMARRHPSRANHAAHPVVTWATTNVLLPETRPPHHQGSARSWWLPATRWPLHHQGGELSSCCSSGKVKRELKASGPTHFPFLKSRAPSCCWELWAWRQSSGRKMLVRLAAGNISYLWH